MLQNTKTKAYKILTGFTLIELLIAIAIFGIISVISVQGLYDIVSIRGKQQTIEDSSDSFRVIARIITKAVIEADNIFVPNTNDAIQTKNDNVCQTIKYDNGSSSVLYKSIHTSDVNPECVPPPLDTLDINDAVLNEDFIVTNFFLSPSGTNVKTILLEMEGKYKNSLGDHPIKYSTTINKRS